MHFWVWGILRRWSACAPTAYEVVRDCWIFEKHCSRLLSNDSPMGLQSPIRLKKTYFVSNQNCASPTARLWPRRPVRPEIMLIFTTAKRLLCRSRWPLGLRRRSAAAWLLRLWVRIPLRAWIFVSWLYAVLSCVGRGLCDWLITCPEESYVLLCVINKSQYRGENKAEIWGVVP
jgi:hypothetical protein